MKLLQILNEIEVRNLRSYTITVGGKTIVVAPEDQGRMNWYKADEQCRALPGQGWRLPTKEELQAMYNQLHKERKGNFKDDYYWSSDTGPWQDTSRYAWIVSFGGDNTYNGFKGYQNYVRPVRNL